MFFYCENCCLLLQYRPSIKGHPPGQDINCANHHLFVPTFRNNGPFETFVFSSNLTRAVMSRNLLAPFPQQRIVPNKYDDDDES